MKVYDEKEVLKEILRFAEEQLSIRFVWMQGSRANPNVMPDIYQDFDIVYGVSELEPFTRDITWLNRFGKILLMQEPMKLDRINGLRDVDYTSYLVLFEDGLRIDVSLHLIQDTMEIDDSLTLVLLDKDNRFKEHEASEADYCIQRPDEEQYLACTNEFWWCMNNVAKGIRRDELYYSMKMFHGPVRDMLVRMLEWWIACQSEKPVSAGKDGKRFKMLLPEGLYQRFRLTYSGADEEDFWNAVDVMCDLFRDVSTDVALHGAFPYPEHEEHGLRQYLAWIRSYRVYKNEI